MIELKCRCEFVKMRAMGEPAVQLYCHCDDCQAAQSAPYVAAAIFAAAALEIVAGQVKTVTVKQTPRLRCAECGDPLLSELTRVGMRSLNAYLLPKGLFKPQFHVQCQHAVLAVVDDLPHYKAFPAAFGGKEEFVAW